MRIPTTAVTRRALALGACALLSPLELLPAIADAPPTYSLKGIPGLSAVTGSERPRPELGVIGKGANGDKSGILQFCDRKGCISSFTPPDEEGYVPPWTYDPQYSTRAVSAFDSRREALRAAARAEQAERQQQDDGQPQPTASVVPAKTVDSAREELRAAVEAASGQIVTSQDRYLYAEFTDPLTGAIDDVEFLFSRDAPIVGYRSAPRAGSDDKRQRARIRDIRKALQPSGWKSVGRIVE